MQSDLPKVLHEVQGQPMVHWVVKACREAGATPILLVIGHGGELLRDAFQGDDDIRFVEQPEQLGTGHAVEVCREELAQLSGDTFVLAGDGPLIRAATLKSLRAAHQRHHAAATLATAVLENPTGYGRIVRGDDNRFQAIVEQKNASEAELAIGEVYPSYACFDIDRLLETLVDLPRDPIGGEYYITEVPAMMSGRGWTVELLPEVPSEDVLSINTPEQLAQVDSLLLQRMQTEAAT
jgi:bifunctional UDP-N-acetylglucosamine pyrophosphorylase/glucosamine-1-phosphate N-acetyltransferase